MPTLRDNYAINTALVTAYTNGKSYMAPLAPAYVSMTAALADAAAKGKTTFTVNIAVTYSTATLRLLNDFWLSFRDGVYTALADEGIYGREVDIQLNTSDTNNTSIDFNFTF